MIANHPPDAPMTLGNMRRLSWEVRPDWNA